MIEAPYVVEQIVAEQVSGTWQPPALATVPQATLDAYADEGITNPLWVLVSATPSNVSASTVLTWMLSTENAFTPAQQAAQPDPDLVLAFLGDSNMLGGSASTPYRSIRAHVQRYLHAKGVVFRVVGKRGYGYQAGSGQLFGEYATPALISSGSYRLQDWRVDACNGMRIDRTLVVDVAASTNAVTSTAHGLVAGTLIDIPNAALATAKSVLLVGGTITADTFQLVERDGGIAVDVTADDTGLLANLGLKQLSSGLFVDHEEPFTDIVIMGGTNDISIGGTFASVQADYIEWLNNIDGATTVLQRKHVVGVLPFTLAADSAKQAVRDQVNTWLETYVPTLGPEWTYTVPPELTAAQMQSDGIHCIEEGYRAVGEAVGDTIYRSTEIVPKSPLPVVLRSRQPHLLLTTAESQARIPAQASINATAADATGSFIVAIWHMPFAVGATISAILTGELPYNNWFLLSKTNGNLRFAVDGSAHTIPASDFTNAIEPYKWYRFYCVVDKAKGDIAIFLNGQLLQRTKHPGFVAHTPSLGLYIGGGGSGLPTSDGLYSDFAFGKGALIDIDEAAYWADLDYRHGVDHPAIVDRRRLNEGTGVSFAGPVGTTAGICPNSWIDNPLFDRPFDHAVDAKPKVNVSPMVTWGASSLSDNSEEYMGPYSTNTFNEPFHIPVSQPFTLNTLTYKSGTAGAGPNIVFTLYKNDVATALTLSAAPSATTSVVSIKNHVHFLTGDFVSLVVTTENITSPDQIMVSAGYTP